jgi:hypothetical protein
MYNAAKTTHQFVTTHQDEIAAGAKFAMAHQNEISAAAKLGSNFMDFNQGSNMGQGPQQQQ